MHNRSRPLLLLVAFLASLCCVPPTPLASFDRAYDVRGNLSALTELSGQKTFAYDRVERLTGVTPMAPLPATQAESYTFDAEGNRIASHISAAYQTDDGNRVISDDTNTYAWNYMPGALFEIIPKDGSDPTRFQHNWDVFGGTRLGSIGRGFAYTQFGYDGFGRLSDMYWNVTPRFRTELHFYDGDDMVLDHRGIGTGTEQFRRYVHGQGTDQPLAMEIYAPNAPPTPGTGTVYYFHPDGEGSVRLLTDAAGQVANRYDYDSFGRRINLVESAPQPFGWKGREFLPGPDLIYNRARFYDPAMGT